ncbi:MULTISPECIES: hypothetical protein [Cysteiniphilum]|uniref:Uncharacterized protein n=1 Tax=Cysteiniphilum litorale TaxID=2056700 RepID=A0A8J2Z327_9GAMM|nr:MULTISPECIES: hypothetical protein [Cysteiniphilum]GGF92056.1 hypothetical protein GCM10010995_06530 [Cysteiniphilum litorale]
MKIKMRKFTYVVCLVVSCQSAFSTVVISPLGLINQKEYGVEQNKTSLTLNSLLQAYYGAQFKIKYLDNRLGNTLIEWTGNKTLEQIKSYLSVNYGVNIYVNGDTQIIGVTSENDNLVSESKSQALALSQNRAVYPIYSDETSLEETLRNWVKEYNIQYGYKAGNPLTIKFNVSLEQLYLQRMHDYGFEGGYKNTREEFVAQLNSWFTNNNSSLLPYSLKAFIENNVITVTSV